MILIAQLGGYLNRKSDGPPGFECLWKGYVLFDAMVQLMQQIIHRRRTSTSKSRRPMRCSKSMGHAQH